MNSDVSHAINHATLQKTMSVVLLNFPHAAKDCRVNYGPSVIGYECC